MSNKVSFRVVVQIDIKTEFFQTEPDPKPTPAPILENAPLRKQKKLILMMRKT